MLEKEINDIAVSVVVAVYNRENTLDRCIDSLVHQTLKENEIIIVDDYSEDNSWSVMEKWQARYPDKIRLIKSESKGVAHAKNTGAKVARGQYITFVDSDDYIDYKMLRRLYECAEKNDWPEMVYSPIMKVFGKTKSKFATMVKHETIEDYLMVYFHYLHGKLFRADLFERFGYMPILGQGEDASWLIPLVSYLSTIAYYHTPCYFYELSSNSICIDKTNPQLMEDVIKGSELIIEKINPRYKQIGILRAFLRIHDFSKGRPVFKDILYRYIKEHMDVLEQVEDLEQKSVSLYNMLQEIKLYYTEIPQIVYVNGFKTINEEELTAKCESVLREAPKLIVLDEKNCDLDNCPQIVAQAYQDGEMDFVGKYFAMQACYQKGGIYIDQDIEIDGPFNSLLNDPCFFGFESNEAFTDKVFGACAGNKCIEKILETYEYPNLYNEKYAPLHQRIATVLVGMYNVVIDSCILRKLDYGFCVYPVDMFVYTMPNTNNLHVCHYKSLESSVPDTIELPMPILTSLWDRHTRIEVSKQNAGKLKKDRDFLNEKVKRLEKDRDWLRNKATRLETRVEGLEKDRDWLQNKAARLETKVESMEKDRTWLQNKASRLEAKAEGLEKDRTWLQNKASRLETRVTSLEKDRAWLQNKAASLENRVKHLDATLTEFQSSKLARAGLKISRIFSGKKKESN